MGLLLTGSLLSQMHVIFTANYRETLSFYPATMSVLQVVCISHRCSRPYYLTQRIEVGVDKML